MLRKSGLIVVSMVATFFAASVSAQDVLRTKGEYDTAYLSSANAYAAVYIATNRSKSGPGKPVKVESVSLYYYVYDPAVGYVMWNGDISPNDIGGGGATNLSVNTDTCKYKNEPGCGPVNLRWTATGDFVKEHSGRTTTTAGGVITRQQGNTKEANAEVTGSIGGTSISGGMGQIGSGSFTNLSVEKVR